MNRFKLAIVGASGLVGQSMLKVLEEENMLELFDITLYVSCLSAGGLVRVGKNIELLTLLDQNAKTQKFDFVMMSAGDDVSKEYAKHFADNGAYVIDNSNAFRRDVDVPLVVPEINSSKLDGKSKIIANPNCSTIELVLVLDKLTKLSSIKKVVVSTYQSVSGAGTEAILDFKNQTNFMITEGITNNVIAHIGEFEEFGYCTEEDKIMFETSKILGQHIDLCATTVRVPICFCHGESVFVQFEEKVLAKYAKEALECDYIKVDSETVSLPTKCAGENITKVCRIRNSGKHELAFFIVADNLRRGASYNAVEILKILIEKFFKS